MVVEGVVGDVFEPMEPLWLEPIEPLWLEPMEPLWLRLRCDRCIPFWLFGAPAPWSGPIAPEDIDPVVAPCDGSVGDIEPDGEACEGASGDIEPVVAPGAAMDPPDAPPEVFWA